MKKKAPRNKVLPVTLPLDQYDYLLKQANDNHVSMAAYLRRLILQDQAAKESDNGVI